MHENLVQPTSKHETNGVNERGKYPTKAIQWIKNINVAFIAILTHFTCYILMFKIHPFTDKYAKDNIPSSSVIRGNKERPLVETSSTTTVIMSSGEKYEAKKSIVILIAIFLISLIAMFYVYLKFPELEA